jgi:phosphoserine phosphatase
MIKNLLFVFDFDHTIVNHDTDQWMIKNIHPPIP